MNTNARITSNVEQAKASIQAKGWRNVVKAVITLHSELKKVLNVSNPRPYLNSSRPGEPPRKRTGWGQANVVYELDEPQLTARIGVSENAKYMAIHELRPPSRQRPWLMVTVERLLERLRRIAGGG